MNYGVDKVVGGWAEPMSLEKLLPYTLVRTQIEHKALRDILMYHCNVDGVFRDSVELGCGYGRNLHLLHEVSLNVSGVERDEKLLSIAKELHPDKCLKSWSDQYITGFKKEVFDLVLTYTFLQHLHPHHELPPAIYELRGITCNGGIILLVEETDTTKQAGSDCFYHTVDFYASQMEGCELIHQAPRLVEHGRQSGTIMVFKKTR